MDTEVIEKPWGRELILEKNDKYVVKKLEVNPGQRLSLQYHEKKHETMYVLYGDGSIHLDGKVKLLLSEDVVVIPPGVEHRLHAGPRGLAILETSTPELDDVVRIEDDYNRV